MTAWAVAPTAAGLPGRRELVGRRVRLRPFRPGDLDGLGLILADPDVIRLTGSAATTAETIGVSPVLDERTREWYRSRNACADRLDLAIVDADTGVLVGEIVLNEWDERARTCNLRVLVGPGGRDRGLGSEAVGLLVDHAFADSPLASITLGVLATNPRARRVYERAGFEPVGVERAAVVFDGEAIDEATLALTRDAWARGAGGARAGAPG